MINNKTLVVITSDDQQHGDYKKGETGYIDGYCRGGDGAPYAIVVVYKHLVMVPLNCLKCFKIKRE